MGVTGVEDGAGAGSGGRGGDAGNIGVFDGHCGWIGGFGAVRFPYRWRIEAWGLWIRIS